MPKIAYADLRFTRESYKLLRKLNAVVEDYAAQGYTLTVRQLFYQLAHPGIIPNTMKQYDRVVDLINNARIAGLVDWAAIEDATREFLDFGGAEDLDNTLQSVANSHVRDLWVDQPVRIETWVEKQALLKIINRAAHPYRVPTYTCRGYNSASSQWRAAQRVIRRYEETGQRTLVLYVGDHDPSGLDMPRDLESRFELFMAGDHVEIRPIALTMTQIKSFGLLASPNPVKTTDSRAKGYVKLHGTGSWELDALKPPELVKIITDAIDGAYDQAKWQAQKDIEDSESAELRYIIAKVRDPESIHDLH